MGRGEVLTAPRSVHVEKRALRRRMAARCLAVAPGFAAHAAERVAEFVCASAPFRAAHSVALYAALPGELSCAPLCTRARAAGRRLLWPRTLADGALDFAAAAPEDLRPGRYGVRAPDAQARAVALGPGVLVVTPGLAFDATGARLGRGGGGYDRALSQAGGAVAVGIGFAFQRVAHLPREPHDVPLHAVVTEAGYAPVAVNGARASRVLRFAGHARGSRG